MYFKQKSNVIFRSYDSFGYITDNRNFGYKQINSNENYIGDKILSESGSVFFSVLQKNPQTLDELAGKICLQFTDVDIDTIKDDAKEFYCMLEHEGFVVSGARIQDCYEKDIEFSYKASVPETTKKDSSSKVVCPSKTSHDFLEEYFNGKPQLTNLHIEITSKCNERCIHCYIPHENKVCHIESNLFYSILEQCKEMRLLHLTLSGGEPMLHRKFCDFLRKCNEYSFSVNVLSNLTLLDDKIVKVMRENPLLGVQVSLYSMDSSIHDGITQVKGSFEKTKNAILKLIENDIPLQISCPIMKQNRNSYEAVLKWAESHKIQVGDDYVIIGRYDHTTTNLDCRMSMEEVKDLIRSKSKENEHYINQLKIEAEKKKNIDPDDYVCSVCHSSICITENGNVYPCAGWQDYIVGDINESSLNDIWNNSEKVQYLRDLRKRNFPKCLKCSDKEFCTMCMVRNANENSQGDPLAVNEYFCSIAKFNKEIART